MAVEFCDSGLDFLGDIPWETHLCQFYQTKEDLIGILVPFLRAGLKHNEFCVWVISDIVSMDDAIEAMRKEVPDIDGFIRSGQLEIFPHTGWYAGDDGFNAQKVLDGWSQKLDHALKKGYAGARITGDTMWLQKKDWKAFMSYESAINDVIEGKKLIVLCTYPLDRCGANEVIDVINTHQSALVRRDGVWEIIESQGQTRLSEVLRKARGELEARVRERTGELVRQAELLDLAHDAIIVRDMDGKIVFWSCGAEGTYGWGKGEAVGKISHDLLRTEFPVSLKEIMTIAGQMGRWEGELTHVGKDGKKIVVLSRWALRQDETGGAVQILEINRDITGRKRVEEALRLAGAYNRSLIEASLDPLVTIDADGTITDVNLATEKVTGYTRDELTGTDFSNYFTEPQRARDGYRRVFSEGSVQDYPLEILHRDGHSTPVLYNAALYRDDTGKVIGAFAAARDITERKRAESRLIRATEEWERTFDAITDPIMIVDTDHRVMKANRAMADKLGVSPSSAEGLRCFEAMHCCHEPPPFCPHSRLLVDGQAGVAEVYDERLGGYFLVSVSPLYDPDGKLFGSVHYARDITERKRAEETVGQAFAYNRSLIEASLDPLVTIDPEGKISDVNAATELVTGRSRIELIGTDFSDYFTEPERARSGYRLVFKKGLVRDYELGIRHKDGHVTPVLYNASVYKDKEGKVIGVFAAARDITERKTAQEELQKLLADLDWRVKERTRELSEANQSLQAVNRELESFSYSVSHDLRAPLRAIDGFSRMLLKDYADTLDDDGRRKLNVVRSNTQTMGQLIDDLLSFSRLGRKEMTKTSLDMEALVRDTWKDLTAVNLERQPTLVLNRLPSGIGDRTLIRQVILNLLSNAIKFSRSREDASIEVGVVRQTDEPVYFIKDNGVGFDMEYHGKLFGVFQRLHSQEEFEGTGVGLAIVERIIHRHGGKVWAEGKVDEGATFYFTLPGKE
ncbi:MAG TPA: hypothetical protein DDZ40_00590 [Deltaproteobacteria bacterium]|nr:hypothetical protein [Deltaproteobacteria bacterium]